jgi:hypothetical protein
MKSTSKRPAGNVRDEAHALLDRLFDLVEHPARVPNVALLSQLDGQRYPGAERNKHLRVWKLAFAAGDPGATKQGRSRLLTVNAWHRWCGKLPSRAKVKPAPVSHVSVDDEMLEDLGGKRAS